MRRSGALLDLLTAAYARGQARSRFGESSQADLAGTLQLDRTNLVGLLDELESEGSIERRRSPEDRRRHTVVLTQSGRERLARAEFVLAAAEDIVPAASPPAAQPHAAPPGAATAAGC